MRFLPIVNFAIKRFLYLILIHLVNKCSTEVIECIIRS